MVFIGLVGILISISLVPDDPFGLNACLTHPHVQTLLECLKDTYGMNKGIALKILTDLLTEQIGFQVSPLNFTLH